MSRCVILSLLVVLLLAAIPSAAAFQQGAKADGEGQAEGEGACLLSVGDLSDVSAAEGSRVEIGASVPDSCGSVFYEWTFSSTPISSSATLVIDPVAPEDAGFYQLCVTDDLDTQCVSFTLTVTAPVVDSPLGWFVDNATAGAPFPPSATSAVFPSTTLYSLMNLGAAGSAAIAYYNAEGMQLGPVGNDAAFELDVLETAYFRPVQNDPDSSGGIENAVGLLVPDRPRDVDTKTNGAAELSIVEEPGNTPDIAAVRLNGWGSTLSAEVPADQQKPAVIPYFADGAPAGSGFTNNTTGGVALVYLTNRTDDAIECTFRYYSLDGTDRTPGAPDDTMQVPPRSTISYRPATDDLASIENNFTGLEGFAGNLVPDMVGDTSGSMVIDWTGSEGDIAVNLIQLFSPTGNGTRFDVASLPPAPSSDLLVAPWFEDTAPATGGNGLAGAQTGGVTTAFALHNPNGESVQIDLLYRSPFGVDVSDETSVLTLNAHETRIWRPRVTDAGLDSGTAPRSQSSATGSLYLSASQPLAGYVFEAFTNGSNYVLAGTAMQSYAVPRTSLAAPAIVDNRNAWPGDGASQTIVRVTNTSAVSTSVSVLYLNVDGTDVTPERNAFPLEAFESRSWRVGSATSPLFDSGCLFPRPVTAGHASAVFSVESGSIAGEVLVATGASGWGAYAMPTTDVPLSGTEITEGECPVFDADPPVITLEGANPEVIDCGGPYTEPGVSATDAVDGPVTVESDADSSIDLNTPGFYAVEYRAEDAAGNEAIAIRDVFVRDDCITLEGEGDGAVDGEGGPEGEGTPDGEVVPDTRNALYVSPLGSDSTGTGTAGSPWRSLAFALGRAKAAASSEFRVVVYALPGTYDEILRVPAYVTLRGAGTEDPSASIIQPDADALLAVAVAVDLAEGARLEDLEIRLPIDAPPSRTLLRINNVNAAIRRVLLNGNLAPQAIGVQILGKGSSETSFEDSVIKLVYNGLRAIDTAASFTRNTFQSIEDTAVTVYLGESQAIQDTPVLGDIDRPEDTGSNTFINVGKTYVRNLALEDTLAQFNDWSLNTTEEIAAKMSGPVVFSPFLKRTGVVSTELIIAVEDENGGAVTDAQIRIIPGNAIVAPTPTPGVFAATVVAGRYSIDVSAPGRERRLVIADAGDIAVEIGPVVLPSTAVESAAGRHQADINGDGTIGLSELLRVVQLFNARSLSCSSVEDGYQVGPGGGFNCERHAADFLPPAWEITLSETLRLVQFYNLQQFQFCPGQGTEDGFCA
ncbi:MAG: DUF5011 domain-containing protein [Candidatus Hydrogenedens sp.]|nr:DUF5011 domain-containing protein [Candidatus Hydrogenedens sp.]